jgi:hypothetical protein
MSDSHEKTHGSGQDPVVHNPEEGFDHTEPRTAWIASFGAVIIVTLLVVILGIQYYFDRFAEQQIYQEVLAPVAEDLTNLRDREDMDLHQDKYIDRKAGTVRISIERSMDLMVQDAASGKFWYPTNPQEVKPIQPEGAPAPAPGTNGAPAPGSAAPAGPPVPGANPAH